MTENIYLSNTFVRLKSIKIYGTLKKGENMLFKNCNLLNLKTGELTLTDVLVKGERIEKLGETKGNGIDLGGKIVMPGFANCYLNYERASLNSFNKVVDESVLFKKNILSGVCFDFFDVKDITFIENLEKLSESEFLKLCMGLKDKIFIKIGQNLNEMGEINTIYRKMPSEVLEDFGVLDKNVTVVGGNCFEKDELELLGGYNANFVLLPNDDARSGRRFININSLNRLNIPFGLGSGEYAEIDFFAFMRELLSFNSFVMENSSLMSEQEALLHATLIGAKILGFDGEIKEGNYANFIVLDGKTEYDDIFKAIVYGMSKQNVYMTVKNGKILQQNGVFAMEK